MGQTKPKATVKTTAKDTNSIRYRLYPTQNVWNFIKLDTRTGLMWQVQYSLDRGGRMTVDLNSDTLVSNDKQVDGRFTLVPTQNISNFILLDQIDGKTWQVQWAIDSKNRLVIEIE
ncbi:MAG: hypothetical protein JNM67_11825 [Bacteroidetes bacterium]|nr:hypothetical protein [Bacteroidota bacterium]